MGIKDGDDIDFLRYGDSTYLIAKKNDIVKMLAKTNTEAPKQPAAAVRGAYTPFTSPIKNISIEPNELAVLKKLDTLKYNDRTNVKVAAMLNSEEKAVLQVLIKKSIIVPFRKGTEKEVRYSIQKAFYDMFLYRNKRPEQQMADPVQVPKAKLQQQKPASSTRPPAPTVQKAWEQKLTGSEGSEAYMSMLESKGFLVLNNEAEAAIVSASLEDSIRQGLVVGTRAFNKKFYIGLRGFINKYALKILKVIDQKSVNIDDIAKEAGVEEDGARTILYFLSESGDVTEVRRDIFRAA